MKGARTVVLVGVALLVLAAGPMVLLLAALCLYFPRVRGWLRPSGRVVVWWVAAALAVGGVAVVVPDGWVPIPPGPGAWVTPSYVGGRSPPGPRRGRPESRHRCAPAPTASTTAAASTSTRTAGS